MRTRIVVGCGLLRNKFINLRNLSPSGADRLYGTKDKVQIGITKTTGVFSTHGFCRYGWSSEIGGAKARYLPSPPPHLKKDEHGHCNAQTANRTRQADYRLPIK